jgi:hypothetical protein
MALILSGDTGPSFVQSAAQPTGSVLQVVNGSTNAGVTSSTNTFIDTGLTATITPKFATSKILVVVSQNGLAKNNNTYMSIYLVRNGSNLFLVEGAVGYTGESTTNYVGGTSLTYLDSPASTSALTYKTQFNSTSNFSNVVCQVNSATSTITLTEIAG